MPKGYYQRYKKEEFKAPFPTKGGRAPAMNGASYLELLKDKIKTDPDYVGYTLNTYNHQ